jgi:hypothetical protein
MGRPVDLSKTTQATTRRHKVNEESFFWDQKSFESKKNSRVFGAAVPPTNMSHVALRGDFYKEEEKLGR